VRAVTKVPRRLRASGLANRRAAIVPALPARRGQVAAAGQDEPGDGAGDQGRAGGLQADGCPGARGDRGDGQQPQGKTAGTPAADPGGEADGGHQRAGVPPATAARSVPREGSLQVGQCLAAC